MVTLQIGLGVTAHNLPKEAIKKIQKNLTFENPEYNSAMKQGRYIPAGLSSHIELFQLEGSTAWFPRGYVYFLRNWLKENNYETQVDDRTLYLKPLELKFLGELRPYQTEAVRDMLTYPIGVLEAATGAGKTASAIYLIYKRKQPTLVIVHSKELLYQWKDQIKKFLGVECGLIGDGKFDIQPITVGIINTVNKRISELTNHFGHIIVDETHKCAAKTYMDILQEFPARYYLGLSATMYRRDGLGNTIFACIGPKKHKVNKEMLQDIGAILVPEIYRVPTDFTYFFQNDYSSMIKVLTHDHKRNMLICSKIQADFNKYKEPIIIVSDRKNHCEMIQKMLSNTYMIEAEMLTGSLNKKDRTEIVKRLRNGKCKIVIATTNLISEGFDLPELNALFITTPIKFGGKVTQLIGRIRRPSEHSNPRIYDFRDNNVNVLKYSGFARDRVYSTEGM
jgi:superfamily II DNA or RNA helicase